MITVQTFNLGSKIWYLQSWHKEEGKNVLAKFKSQEAEWYNCKEVEDQVSIFSSATNSVYNLKQVTMALVLITHI